MIPEPIAVFGGSGFIGTNLVQRLEGMGADVTSIDVRTEPFRPKAKQFRQRELSRQRVTGFATVFHLAADMGGVGYFHSDKDWRASTKNAEITAHVMRNFDGDRLIYASSLCALAEENSMDPNVDQFQTEKDLYWGTPDATYGLEKRTGALLCERAPFDARVAILDTVYGKYQEYSGQRTKFPSAVATKAIAARQTGKLEMWGTGEQKRCFLYVNDAIDRLLQIADADENYGPVIVGSEQRVTCNEIAEMCLDIAGAKAEIVNIDGPVGVVNRGADLSKWKKCFGETSETPVRAGFEKFIAWLDELAVSEAA